MLNRRLLLILASMLTLASCSTPTPAQLAATAQVLGCYPYGFIQEPTKTLPPASTPGIGTPTATATTTPAPTWTSCTPAPQVPTVTPTLTWTPTPWTRPTQLPAIQRSTPPVNLSNQPGYDTDAAIAVHPTEGWAAVVWVNWLAEFENEATVLVKVQGRENRTWSVARGVNTGPVYKNRGAPGIAIDRNGRIHVVFLAGAQDQYQVVSTWSDDAGVTWSTPEPIPGTHGGLAFTQMVIDQADQLHVLFADRPCGEACVSFSEAIRPVAGGSWVSEPAILPGKHRYGDLVTVQQPDGRIRTIIVAGCSESCPGGPGVLVTYRDDRGPWRSATIPNQAVRVSPQAVYWVDLLASTATDGRTQVCAAWAQYARSAVHAACSADAGATWGDTEVIVFHSAEIPADPGQPTATPGGDDGAGSLANRGYHPELVYDPATGRLLAIWVYAQVGTPGQPSTLVYSYRDPDGGLWTPQIDEAAGPAQPVLRLFQDTRRSAARNPRLAIRSDGLAAVVWTELERDESPDVYFALFNPAALVAEEN